MMIKIVLVSPPQKEARKIVGYRWLKGDFVYIVQGNEWVCLRTTSGYICTGSLQGTKFTDLAEFEPIYEGDLDIRITA